MLLSSERVTTSVVIPPILQVMLTGFGFQGMEGAGEDALAAPQAALMSSVASGIFDSSLPANLRQRALPFHTIAAGTAGDEMVREALGSLDAPAARITNYPDGAASRSI